MKYERFCVEERIQVSLPAEVVCERRALKGEDVYERLRKWDVAPRSRPEGMASPQEVAKRLGIFNRFGLPDMEQEMLRAVCPNDVAFPGPMYAAHGYQTKAAAWSEAIRDGIEVVERLVSGEEDVPAPLWAMGQRTKVIDLVAEEKSGKREVARGVLMPDAYEHVIYAPIAKPILEAIAADDDNPIALGHKWQAGGGPRLASKFYGCKEYAMTDIKNWDGATRASLTTYAFEVIKCAFRIEGPAVVYRGKSISRAKMLDVLIGWMARAMAAPVVVLPGGQIYRLPGGVPSGSVWTTLINSIINYAYWLYAIRKAGAHTRDYTIKVYGDDSLVGVRSLRTPHMSIIRRHMELGFGITVSVEKSYDSDHFRTDYTRHAIGAQFLGKNWDAHYLPIRPEHESEMALYMPSSVRRGFVDEVCRSFGVACDNPFCSATADRCARYIRWLVALPVAEWRRPPSRLEVADAVLMSEAISEYRHRWMFLVGDDGGQLQVGRKEVKRRVYTTHADGSRGRREVRVTIGEALRAIGVISVAGGHVT